MTKKRIRQNPIDKFNGNFLKLTEVLDGKNDQLLHQLTALHTECKIILEFAHEYDLDKDTPFNGFRSFVKMIAIYFAKLVSLSEGTPSRRRIKNLHEFEALAETFVAHLSILNLIKGRDGGLESSDWNQDNSVDQMVTLDKILSCDPKQINLFYRESIRSFWLCPSMRKFLNNFYLPLILLQLFPLKLTFKSLFDKKIRKNVYADFAANASLSDIKTLWQAGEARMSRVFMRGKSVVRGKCKSMKFFRQKEWNLTPDGRLKRRIPDEVDAESDAIDSKKEMSDDQKRNTSFVKVMYIHYGQKGQSRDDSLIFHSHGGGFIAMTPKGHEAYLRKWARKLKVPVISVYYRLAPDHPYPAALQDVLDSYLYLTSGTDRIKSFLGFHPKNIVLAGDSAGGNLSVALALVLADIKKEVSSLIMPTALSVQYPLSNPVLGCTSASRSQVIFDTLLSVGAAHACCVAIVGITRDYELQASIQSGNKPWYRRDRQEVKEIFCQYQQSINYPFFNVLSSNNFEALKDIKLFIQASEFDPLLDDSIAIAKKWKGIVKLDVIPDVNHGFLAFQGFSPEAKRASKITTKRISQGLGFIPMD